MKKIIYISLSAFIISCSTQKKENATIATENSIFFNEVKAVTSGNEDLILPKGFSYQVLFQGGKDSVVRADGQKFLSKESNDMLSFLPIDGSSEHGYLYTSHETYRVNPDLGDGGGASIMEIKKEDGKWNVISDIRHFDFSSVRETSRNCGGTPTPHGTVLTCE